MKKFFSNVVARASSGRFATTRKNTFSLREAFHYNPGYCVLVFSCLFFLINFTHKKSKNLCFSSRKSEIKSKIKNPMSSHHIVRDDQEPALIIANGAACNPELLGQLLEWSPLVIVLDSAMERVMELDIKVDVLLGDFDRGFNPEQYQTSQYPIEIIHTPDQNKTDLEKAFDYLIARKIPAVNVVWATGKRADHTITNITNITRY